MLDRSDAEDPFPLEYYRLEPPPPAEDLAEFGKFASNMGYNLLIRDPGYLLEEIQSTLREEGPSSLLSIARIQEDISAKAPQATAEEFVRKRIARLSPASDLLITDPFLFTKSRERDAAQYAESVADIVSAALKPGVTLTAVVSARNTSDIVREALIETLKAKFPNLISRVIYSEDFHDRFWIADRSRGLVMGTSLNKIGSKVFFVDKLSTGDVAAVLQELPQLRGTRPQRCFDQLYTTQQPPPRLSSAAPPQAPCA